tara:strand:+ start:363 stop:980 length:618 start_codon:yes stop_codon:yes gene_type:complete
MSDNMVDSIIYKPVIVSPQEQQFIEETVLGGNFPWYWKTGQRFDTEFFFNKHIPDWFRPFLVQYNPQFFSHSLITVATSGLQSHTTRSQTEISPFYDFFIEIFHRFMVDNNIQYSKIYRAALNFNWYNDLAHTEPHIDHSWPHNNFIMYLNTCDNGQTLIWPEDFSTTYFIPCIKYTAAAFKQQWHAHRYPAKEQRRVVCVVTYI